MASACEVLETTKAPNSNFRAAYAFGTGKSPNLYRHPAVCTYVFRMVAVLTATFCAVNGHACLPDDIEAVECYDSKAQMLVNVNWVRSCALHVRLDRTYCVPAEPTLQCTSRTGAQRNISTHCIELHNTSTALPQDAIKVYFADLPRQYNWGVWWNKSDPMASLEFELTRGYMGQLGKRRASRVSMAGPLRMPEASWYDSSHYSARVAFDVQLRRSGHVVDDVHDADVVFVQYHHEQLYKENKTLFRYETHWHFWRMVETYLPHLHEKPHFFVISVPDIMVFRSDGFWFWPFADLRLRATVTALIIEVNVLYDYPTWTPRGPTDSNIVVIPYPSNWHLPMDPSDPGWAQNKHHVNPTESDIMEIFNEKSILVSSAWATRKDFREIFVEQCKARPNSCIHLENQKVYNNYNSTAVYHLFRKSWFCVQPRGDTLFRKSIWDCLAIPAIPVGTEKEWAMPAAFFPFSHAINWTEITAYVSWEVIHQQNFVDYLEEMYPLERRQQMLRRIIEVRHALQYSTRPDWDCLRWQNLKGVRQCDDAITLSMRSMLYHMCLRGLVPQQKCDAAINNV